MAFRRRTNPLEGRVCVVTGASSGIGRAVALALAERGCQLVLTARRERLLTEVADACEALKARCEAAPGDVTRYEHVEAISRLALSRFGRIDAWVNNAGVLMFGRNDECPPESYTRVVQTNLLGCMHGSSCAIRVFRQQRWGTLVNVSSLLAAFSSSYAAAYVASKYAVEGLSAAIRQEVHDLRDVHVVNVRPAAVDTPILEHAANYMGRSVKPLFPLVSADKVAAVIVDCIRRPRPSAIVGRTGRLEYWAHELAPATHDRVVARLTHAAQRRASPATNTSGSLFEPRLDTASTDGGWKKQRARRRRLTLMTLTAVCAAIMLARAGRPSSGVLSLRMPS